MTSKHKAQYKSANVYALTFQNNYTLSAFRMIGKNTRTWLNEGNEFHLIESTANLVHHFISHSNVTNSFVR